jgi:integrase
MAEINKNMLRDRAEKLEDITDDKWNSVNKHNKDMVEEFLSANKQLSKETLKQYTSALRIFFYFVKENLNDKPLYKITKRDFIKYFGFLQEHKLSSSALKFKKSAVSTLCIYVENIVAEEEEDYKNFRNFTKAITDIPLNKVYDKVAITQEEYELIMSVLEKKEDYLAMAWVATAFNIGARKAELTRIKTEIIDYPFDEEKGYIESHIIYGKGRGGGKPLKYMINTEALKYIKLWVEKRGYEHEYIFTVGNKDNPRVISMSWANMLTVNTISPILGRRIHVHCFKGSCITNLLEQGVDMKIVSKFIAHHESVSTTSSAYDLRNDDSEKDEIFKIKK